MSGRFGDAQNLARTRMGRPRRVHKIEKRRSGAGDHVFLERVFQKLPPNLTWWVNRKDAEGNNVFRYGPGSLDNIGVRSVRCPVDGWPP
ncbi:MAG: hypothetical protein R2712_28970 [Vicinamibacterales bacterium]